MVFAELRQAILSGRLSPGERLPPQRTLAAEFGVNMVSVREALKRLEQLRLVETRHGKATHVRNWRSAGGLEALASLKAVDPDLLRALFEARRLLLVEASRLAAQRRSDKEAAAIGELAAAFAHAADEQAALLVDWAFMEAVVEASGNLIFQLIMNSVRELYLPSAAPFVRMLGDGELYAQAAEAIRAGDADAAAESIGSLAAAQEQRMVSGR
jgi:GntR family transcriptional regulator, transcriptional repressor for pyruvate dehydrogenase complex